MNMKIAATVSLACGVALLLQVCSTITYLHAHCTLLVWRYIYFVDTWQEADAQHLRYAQSGTYGTFASRMPNPPTCLIASVYHDCSFKGQTKVYGFCTWVWRGDTRPIRNKRASRSETFITNHQVGRTLQTGRGGSRSLTFPK